MASGKTLELRKITKAPPQEVCVCGQPYHDKGGVHYTKLGVKRVRSTCSRHLKAGLEGVAGVGASRGKIHEAQFRRFQGSPRSAAPASFHTAELVRDIDRAELYMRRVQRREISTKSGKVKVVWVPGPRVSRYEVI